MKLCETYYHIRNGLLYIKGESNCAYLLIIVNQGANDDGDLYSGLNHICEHIFLKLVETYYEEVCKDEFFEYKGHTDYTITTYEFRSANKKENINQLLISIAKSLDIEFIPIEIIKQSRDEVIKEFDHNKNIETAFEINSFICNEKINYVPLGNINNIYDINDKDYLLNIIKFKNHIKYGIISDIPYGEINFSYLSKYEGDFFISKGENKFLLDKSNAILDLSNYNNSSFTLFIIMNYNRDDMDFITENIFEMVIQIRILEVLKEFQNSNLKIEIKRKMIKESYYFISVSVQGLKQQNRYYTFNFENISMKEFYNVKQMLIHNLKEMKSVNMAFIINNIQNYYIYNDMLMLTESDINSVVKNLEFLTYKKFTEKLQEIKTDNIKIVYN